MITKSQNLVFTSAGDNTRFPELWISEENNFDLVVCYYGDNVDVFKYYQSISTHAFMRRGSKFQNFFHLYNESNLSKYQRYFVLDDDIEFLSSDINKMFKISEDYGLQICQPSFDAESKAAWPITRQIEGSILRYTNWVEVNTPLFTKPALQKLMDVYDSNLIGWGIDYLYIWANGLDEKFAYAIVDSVVCRNPKDELKNGIRELSYVEGWQERSKIWQEYRDRLGIEEWDKVIHETVFST